MDTNCVEAHNPGGAIDMNEEALNWQLENNEGGMMRPEAEPVAETENTPEVRVNRSSLESDILDCRWRQHKLKEETAALYEELLDLRRDREMFCQTFVQQQDSILVTLLNEIERTEFGISLLETQMRNSRKEEGDHREAEEEEEEEGEEEAEVKEGEVMVEVEEQAEEGEGEGKEKKTEDSGPGGDEEEMRPFRIEEDEARVALEDLKDNVRKVKDQLRVLKRNVNMVQKQCQEEEKNNIIIQLDLEELKKLDERIKKEERMLQQDVTKMRLESKESIGTLESKDIKVGKGGKAAKGKA